MTFQPADITLFKQQALHWAASFDVCCHLGSNGFADPYSKFDCLIAAGVKAEVTGTQGTAFTALKDFKVQHPLEWITGFLGYDLKNEVENLHSRNFDGLRFPDLYFFIPKYLIVISGDKVSIECGDAESVYHTINTANLAPAATQRSLNIKTRFSKPEYLEAVNTIREHINRGDIYVTNFCQEFYAEGAQIDPADTFIMLNQTSPNPFACFFRYHDKYIICASPERFLAKRNNKLISQPIKGTAKRGADDQADEAIKLALKSSQKEQQENVMIVDLVRNDLTRSAKAGTVRVEELFGIYSFRQVHQMISTVVCELDERTDAVDAIKNTFPMGSMTGAPKVSAMQLMEAYERTKRSVYSGAIGYFGTDGDFDFNVVIRSILYNASTGYLSFQAGSAITFDADAAYEYHECLLKVKAILEVLGVESL